MQRNSTDMTGHGHISGKAKCMVSGCHRLQQVHVKTSEVSWTLKTKMKSMTACQQNYSTRVVVEMRNGTVDCSHLQRESQQRIAFHVVLSQRLHKAANCCNNVADLCTCSGKNVNVLQHHYDHESNWMKSNSAKVKSQIINTTKVVIGWRNRSKFL